MSEPDNVTPIAEPTEAEQTLTAICKLINETFSMQATPASAAECVEKVCATARDSMNRAAAAHKYIKTL